MIYRLDEFVENSINPITNKPYDSSWIVLQLTDATEYQMMNGSFNGCAYSLKISKNYDNWKMSVCDFVGFNEKQNKNIIMVISESDLSDAQQCYKGYSFDDSFLRNNEPSVLVHSTTLENWQQIQKDGCLKSWNLLKSEGEVGEETPIGSKLGDPSDFSDYIMFSAGESVSGEIVVMSKQQGKIIVDENREYLTGARLYLDIKRIAEDGLLIRDGAHLKVKDSLPLKPYLLWSATWENVGLSERKSTPKIFTQKANEMFRKLYRR